MTVSYEERVGYLERIFHLVALADAADAGAAVGAERAGGRVGRPAAALLAEGAAAVRRALAALAEPACVAEAHAASHHALVAAHSGPFVERLRNTNPPLHKLSPYHRICLSV